MTRLLAAASLLALLSCADAGSSERAARAQPEAQPNAQAESQPNAQPDGQVASVTTDEEIWIEGEGFAAVGADGGVRG